MTVKTKSAYIWKDIELMTLQVRAVFSVSWELCAISDLTYRGFNDLIIME